MANDSAPAAVNKEAAATASTPLTVQLEGQAWAAERLAAWHADELKFVHGVGWHEWDGTRWSTDQLRSAQHTLIEMMKKLKAVDLKLNPDGKSDTARNISKVSRNSDQRGALEIATTLPAMKAAFDDMDPDPWLLNCSNGTLDLHSMTLRPHDRNDLITKITHAAYDESADMQEWLQFLETILPDADVRHYLQRFAGLSLIGDVREHIMAIAHGESGANGKSTFYEALSYALGDYAEQSASELFMQAKVHSADAARPALMKLRGRRLVVASETESRAPLASSLVKALTGGDPITARPLYGAPVTFIPSHTFLLVTNHLPRVSGDDDALFRRIAIIPFNVQIPVEQRDPTLGERLKQNAEAVLLWAVQGLSEYLANGLQTPKAVQLATSAYQSESDDIGQFLRTRFVKDPQGSVERGEMWNLWQQFEREESIPVSIGRNKFYQRIEQMYPLKRIRNVGSCFSGIRAAESTDLDSVDESAIINEE